MPRSNNWCETEARREEKSGTRAKHTVTHHSSVTMRNDRNSLLLEISDMTDTGKPDRSEWSTTYVLIYSTA